MTPQPEIASRRLYARLRYAKSGRSRVVPEPLPRPVSKAQSPAIRLGSAPGPESWPKPETANGAEKLARAKLYHADLLAGRPIRYVPRDFLLSDSNI